MLTLVARVCGLFYFNVGCNSRHRNKQTQQLIMESTMNYAIAGGAVVGRPFDAFKSIQFHPSNILTSASFSPPPHKTLWQRFIEFVCRRIQP